MDRHAVVLASWSYGIAVVIYLAFALHLLRLRYQGQSAKPARAFLGVALVSIVWAVAGLLFSRTDAVIYFVSWQSADILRYGAWFAFLLLLIRASAWSTSDQDPVPRTLGPVAWGLVTIGLGIQVTGVLGLANAEDFQRLTLLSSLFNAIYALVLLEQLFRNVTSDSLWNIKPLCLGLVAAFGFDLYLYSGAVLFNHIDPDAFVIRGGVHALVVPLLGVSTIRGRDWISKIRLSQRAAFHSATLLISGAYLLFVAGAGYYVRYFGGDWGDALQIAAVFAGLLIFFALVISGSMRAKLRVWVGKNFFSYRYDYREEWLRFTQTLSTQNSPRAMGEQVIRGLANMLESPGGTLLLKDASSANFRQMARWNMPEIAEEESLSSPFSRFLEECGWVINLEEYRVFRGRYRDLELPDWLLQLPNAWLVVPLAVGEELIGFVVLASARTPVEVDWEINDLLKTAGRQAASFLAQMQATEALLEVRKFDAFNRMSAFVVHDLKNIVTQLALMLRNAEKHRDNPEFQQDMLMTVEHAVERMRQLMLQLREGATPPGSAYGVDLADIVERVHKSKQDQGRSVTLSVSERLSARGHEERIERIIGHVVQNAIDATGPGGEICITLERHAGHARVAVADTGHGMSEEFIRERLFKPFQTTKQTGMGIGAYESFQYVQELGGKIEVESKVNQGTKVSMLLPLFEGGRASDLHHGAGA